MSYFLSDNGCGVHPAIMEAMAACNDGMNSPYGADEYSAKARARFCEVFEKEVTVVFIGTGTAANALALSLYTPSYGAILCHEHAHIVEDECGAPGFFTGGAQTIGVPGAHGKIDPAALQKMMEQLSTTLTHPSALSLTQATEAGTVYTLSELDALVQIAKAARLAVHMDGARFANALVSLNCTPAEMTWKRGVDALSFGATKNGCMNAEALVLFEPSAALESALQLRRKQAGHTASKMRFLAAQFLAYFTDDLWLRSARHANAMAKELAENLAQHTGLAPVHAVEANEVFLPLSPSAAQALRHAGWQFYDWPDGSCRFVTSFATIPEDVAGFASFL